MNNSDDYASTPRTGVPACGVGGPRISYFARLTALVVGAGLVGMWTTAASLTPSPHGFGTHQGLGLPPCSIVQWTGVRCPSCGMTTSWAYLIRGNLPASLYANTGGCLLGIMALAAVPWCVGASVTGRWWLISPDERVGLAAAMSVLLVTMVDWLLRLA